jgi:hypothetical protein
MKLRANDEKKALGSVKLSQELFSRFFVKHGV